MATSNMAPVRNPKQLAVDARFHASDDVDDRF